MERLLDYFTNHPLLAGGFLAMVVVVLAYEIRERGAAAFAVAPNEAIRLANAGAVLVDLRSPNQFKDGHIAGARNLPGDQIAADPKAALKLADKTIVLYCQTATRTSLSYMRTFQDDGDRYDQLLGGDGNLISELNGLSLDIFSARVETLGALGFDHGSFTYSINSQREERVNQGGNGNPTATIGHEPERTTAQGIQGVLKEGAEARTRVISELVAGIGGKALSQYWAFGDEDYFLIAELPSNTAAAALAARVSATGTAGISTTVLLTAAELDEARGITVGYRPPGASGS